MPDMLSKEEMDKILAEAKEQLHKRITTEIVDGVAKQISWKMEEIVSKELNDLIRSEVKALCEKYKAEIIAHIASAFTGVGIQFEDAVKNKIAENLKQSWNVKKIMEGLFQ